MGKLSLFKLRKKAFILASFFLRKENFIICMAKFDWCRVFVGASLIERRKHGRFVREMAAGPRRTAMPTQHTAVGKYILSTLKIDHKRYRYLN